MRRRADPACGALRETGALRGNGYALILEGAIENTPHDYRTLMTLGLAYAGLGRKDESVRASERAVEIRPVSPGAAARPPALPGTGAEASEPT